MRSFAHKAVGVAVLMAAACGTDTLVYPGGPAGPMTSIELSNSRLVVTAGSSQTVGLVGRDAAGNPTADAVSVASCNSSIATASGGAAADQWSTTASVTAVGLGETCVIASAGGLSDTIRVITAPAGMQLTGPTSVPSGGTADFTVVYTDANGAVMTPDASFVGATITSTNTARVRTPGTPGDATVSGRAPGAVTLEAALPDNKGATTAVYSTTVVAGTFAGTLTASSGEPGTVVTATRAAGGEPFDGDTDVHYDGRFVWIISKTADNLTFAIPPSPTAGAHTLTIGNMGDAQVSQNIDFTTNSISGNPYEPASDACGTAVDFDANAESDGWVYFAFNNTSVGWGGAAPDTWFKVDGGASGRTVDLRFEWSIPVGTTPYADADMYVYATCGAGSVASSAQYNPPQGPFEEIIGLSVPAGETRYIDLRVWSAQGAGPSSARLRVQ